MAKQTPVLDPTLFKGRDWKLPKMQDLSRYKRITLDTEGTGLNVWSGHHTIGVVVALHKFDGTVDSRYYPYGHPSGPQYDKSEVMDWLRRELRKKELVFHHYNFDAMMLYHDGLDVREHGNYAFDTQFAGALIEPKDPSNLDFMAQKHVGNLEGKLQVPFSPEQYCQVPSWALAAYAEQDGVATSKLFHSIFKKIKLKCLEKVFRLECETAPAVLEMELNGLRIDEGKYHDWIPRAEAYYEKSMNELEEIDKFSSKQLVPAFDKRGIIYPYNYICKECDDSWIGFKPQECPRCGETKEPKSPHFGKKYLAGMNHPFAKKVVKTKQIKNLLGSYLKPWECQIRNGILRFNLNQLMSRDRNGDSKGTISGRFSANMWEGGFQPQQIWSPEKQIEEFGFEDFILRELFIPDPGQLLMRIDASQIEYRLFAHYSESQHLIKSYIDNPDIDFHQTVADDILQGLMGPGKIGRKKAKNINFGKLYGMGHAKFARDVGVSKTEGKRMYNLYDKMFPEAKEIIDRWSRRAGQRKPVETLLGRRFFFGRGDPTYVALNRLIQGSAADVMKSALRLVYREKLTDKMRITVHDELVADVHSEAQAVRCKEAMQEDLQHLIRVPVLWDLEVGQNWAMRDA